MIDSVPVWKHTLCRTLFTKHTKRECSRIQKTPLLRIHEWVTDCISIGLDTSMDGNVYIVIHLGSALQRYIYIYKNIILFVYIYMILKQHYSTNFSWGQKQNIVLSQSTLSLIFFQKESFIKFLKNLFLVFYFWLHF